jgi:hypothetical protein
MLSGSGLRTFGMTAAPIHWPDDGVQSKVGTCSPRRRGNADGRNLGNRKRYPWSFWRDGASARELAVKGLVSFRKHQAGNGWLEGGRSSLLKSAQEATLSSVAMVCFPRQSNALDDVNRE